jgi:hypothetical protein
MEQASRTADTLRANLRQAREIRSHVESAKATAEIEALPVKQRDDLVGAGEKAA